MATVLGEKCLLDCDLIVVKGASFQATVAWQRDDEPVDLTEATCICQVRRENDGEVIADLSECWVFAADGTAVVSMQPEHTAALIEGKWPWDLMVAEQSGRVTRVLAGKCTVIDPISEDD